MTERQVQMLLKKYEGVQYSIGGDLFFDLHTSMRVAQRADFESVDKALKEVGEQIEKTLSSLKQTIKEE